MINVVKYQGKVMAVAKFQDDLSELKIEKIIMHMS